MKLNIQETLSFLVSFESVLILATIFCSIINLIINSDNSNTILLFNLVLITSYFIISKRKDKKIAALSMIHYSIWGFFIELLIINKTNILSYRKPMKGLSVPLWLITSYSIFILGGIYTYDLIKILLK